MATSPNYGWAEPDNTDLVKNGALAIRTLGNAIDTTMATKAVASNPVINSSFQVWQRGTSVSVPASTGITSAYTADRWTIPTGANQACTVSRQLTNDTTNLPNIQYCARVQRNSGQTGTGVLYFGQNFESLNSVPFAGKQVTASFYARKGADYSPTSSNLTFNLQTGTGTDQNFFGYTGGVSAIDQTFALTSTWQRFSVTATLASNITELNTKFIWTPTGTAGANDYFEVTGVQLDLNAVALPFQTASGGSIQSELAMCQRYYQKSFPQGTAPATNAGRTGAVENFAIRAAGALGISFVRFPVIMRGTPTVTLFNPSAANNQARNLDTGSDCSSTTVEAQTDSSFRYYYTLPLTSVGTNLISAQYQASAEL